MMDWHKIADERAAYICSLESDLATAEQDSRQKQARIDRLEKAVKELREALTELEEAARCVQTGEWSRQSIDLDRRNARTALKNTEDI